MYPLCMILGSSGQGKALPQEDRVPSFHVALLGGKSEWCQARAHWRTEWRSVAFSDERRFCLGASDGRMLVRRRTGERLQPTCLRPRHTGPLPGYMVWETISYDSRSSLVVIPRTLTGNFYVSLSVDILSWPARSPDPSPIEYVCDIIGGQLQRHTQPALTVPVLTDQMQQAWNSISQTGIRHLYHTMHERLHVCIQNSDGYTGY
ncbi:hypothetical protein AVEN_103246-1 [Araneus ventricosus]|uniref:Uncharacterized protein n=1 Tax=Araneus ventricosus TaxID=182803 RepID=A0A4Y2S629_ARAVE|nr:hypothetical protein AVEN_103246-1 [Araneus ventricosus]